MTTARSRIPTGSRQRTLALVMVAFAVAALVLTGITFATRLL